MLTGLAGLEAIKRAGLDRPGIFCWGGLATGAETVLAKTRKAGRIITVDGCPLNCALKIVQRAGFAPAKSLTLVQDCGIAKKSGIQYTDDEYQKVVQAIGEALE